MNTFIQNIKQNMFAIHQLTERDKRRENSATFLGELWEILNPLILTVVMFLVFGNMLWTEASDDYPIFILTGTTLFSYFTQGTSACLVSLVGNKNLLIKSKLRRNIYVTQKIALVFRNFLLSLFVYAFLLAWNHHTPNISWVLVIVDITFFSAMIIGIGKILAVANVFFADTTYFYRIFTVFLLYGSALFFDASRYPAIIKDIIMINPVYDAIYIARELILHNQIVPTIYWCMLFFYAIVLYFVGALIFNKYSDDVVANL
ncbi:MAG: ABC transporter permease [Lachnospiraceae bacterium]|nr:ABC transporter permease [Lachnospiraceae bacterium]